jgi:sporulation protein YlmC with PRC-barrel domain
VSSARDALLSAVTLSLFTVTAGAQTAKINSSSGGTLAHVERAANLFGRQLESSDNQQIGKVNNVVLDLESEHILYVVVNANKGKVAVPPQIFGETTGNTILLNAGKQKIESAPQFTSDIDKPEQLTQASFVAKVYEHFGQNAWWKGSTPADQGTFHNVHKLNDVIGMKVENVNNQTMGKVNNVVVDMPTGRVMYVVLAPDSSLSLGNNLYALPSDALTLSPDKKHLVSNIDQQKLASAPHFEKNSWPNLTDATFASQVYQFYGKQAWFGNAGATGLQPTGR